MLRSQKHVFWEALVLTVVIFFFGLMLGITFEGSRLDEINNYYAQSEISLVDSLALSNQIDLENFDCKVLSDTNLEFADRIYWEALLLEKYEDAGRVTDSLRLAHQKYDLLRTLLWINSIKTQEKCGKTYSLVVYLYVYEPNDLSKKATQNVWSRILGELKQEKGSEVLLIPIAVDSDLGSLDALVERLDIPSFPAVIIDDKKVITELVSLGDLEAQL